MNKYVEYKIDKVRKFRLGLLAQKRIEEKFNCSFAQIDHEGLKIEDFAYMLWATLEQKDRDEVTPEKFMEILDENILLKDVYELFGKITEEAFGKNLIPPIVEEPAENDEFGTGTKQFKTL